MAGKTERMTPKIWAARECVNPSCDMAFRTLLNANQDLSDENERLKAEIEKLRTTDKKEAK